MKFIILSLPLLLFLFQSSCITTRASIEKEEKIQKDFQNLKQGKAEIEATIEDYQEQMRSMGGRIEVLENEKRLAEEKLVEQKEMELAEKEKVQKEFSLMVESVSQMQEKMGLLEKEIEELKKKAARRAPKKTAKKSQKKKGNFGQAEADYANKKWQDAALNYEKYRELNPNGKQYARATYRIGMSFRRLGSLDDAKVFFEEVVSKHSKSIYAKYSKSQLEKLK